MIYGEHIRLRGIEKQDLPSFVAWLNDPEVIQGLTIHIPISLTMEEDWFAGISKRPMEERPMCIEVATDDGWQLIGNVGLHNLEWVNRTCEMGIVIGDKRFWNQGYGTEAMRLLLKYGFETLNFNRMALRVYEYNTGAIKTYEKAGFTVEGRLRQTKYHNGRYHDSYIMSVLRSEWDQQTKQE